MKIKKYIKKSYKGLPKWAFEVLGIRSEEELQIWFERQEEVQKGRSLS